MGIQPDEINRGPRISGRGVISFLVIAFGFSWLQWFAVAASTRGWIGLRIPLTPLGSFGPAVAAFVVLSAAGQEGEVGRWLKSIVRWRVPPWTALAALLLPPAAAVVAFLIASRIRGVSVGPKMPSLGFLLAASLEIFLVGGPLGEEPGWRGFLLPWLGERWGWLRGTFGVWVVWFAWHIPLFWVPGSGQRDFPPLEFAAALLSYAVLEAWLFKSSGGSSLVAALLHTSINVTFVFAATGILEKGQARLFWPIYLGAMGLAALTVLSVSRMFRRRLT